MSGGGGSSSAPTNQTVTSTSIPEYARPYAESMLGQTSALTNINDNPYQPYQGQQVAGFSPMQVQGMTGIANQQVAPQITDASNFAFQSGAGGLGAYQNAARLQNAALDYGAAGAQGAFANADLINAYGGEAYKSGQMGQQLGTAGGAKFGNMGVAAGQLGQDIGTAGGAYYGSQGANLAGANLGVGAMGMQAGMGYGQGAQNPNAVQGYMNPYLQASLQPQLAEMQRQYGISGAQGQSNATRAGAFGGSREALTFAENQRNKNIAMNQAIGQGYNTAYDVANRNMQAASSLGMQGAQVGLAGLSAANQNYLTGLQGVNTQLAGTAQGMQGAQVGLAGVDRQLAGTAQGMQGANIGMQGANQAGQLMLGGAGMGLQGVQGAVGAGQYGLAGLGLAGSAGSTLGALGQTQFGQQQAINQAQMQAGAQQQALQQQGLNVAYQQYQDQMNYPYKQLAFQSDMMRGLPLSQSSQTMYQNTGNLAPQLMGAGIAAYGASAGRSAKEGGLMSYARGGAVQGYAMGGQPTVDPRAVAATSPAALSSKLAQLSDGQLQAYARTVKDAVALAEVKAEMARRAGVRQPQGEEPTQTVAESVAGQGGIAEQPVMAAGGGIVALADGSKEPVRDRPGEIHTDNPDAPTQTPNWTRLFPEGSLIRNLRVPVGSDVRNALNSQRQSADSAVQSGTISPEALAIANEAQQRQEMDSQVQTGTIPRAQLVNMNQAQQRQEMDSQVQPSEFSSSDLDRMTEDQQMQDADSQVQPRGGITAIPPVAGAIPAAPVATGAPVGGGIIPTSAVPPAGGGITDVGTPAAGAPRTGTTAPVNAMTPRTSGATVGSTGAGIPVGVPGDPMNFATYRANVEDMAKLDPEDKATLANMQARTEKRLRRAEKQEKNVMNDAFVAGGLAMMGGLNLSDGIRRAAEQGGKQYFSSQAEARKAIDKADEAQDSFDQYRTALKQGNKKLANEMYGTFYKSYTDYIGKIQAAGITAGASREATQENIKARELAQANVLADRQLARDQQMLIHQQNIQVHKDDVLARIANTQNVQAQTLMAGYETKLSTIQEGIRKTTADLSRTFKAQREELQFSTDKPEVKTAKLKALELRQAAALKEAINPYVDQQARVLAQQDNLMNKILNPGGGNAGGSGASPFRVTEVK